MANDPNGLATSFPGYLIFPPFRSERGETLAQVGHVLL